MEYPPEKRPVPTMRSMATRKPYMACVWGRAWKRRYFPNFSGWDAEAPAAAEPVIPTPMPAPMPDIPTASPAPMRARNAPSVDVEMTFIEYSTRVPLTFTVTW